AFLAAGAAQVFAQTPPADDKPAEPAPPPTPPAEPPPPAVDKNAEASAALEQRIRELEDQLAQTKDDQSYLEDKISNLVTLKLSGYLDLGAFATNGNGAGTREDLAGVYFPEYVGKVPGSWVFMGDPLSTMINSRGDVADTGDSRAITFDP